MEALVKFFTVRKESKISSLAASANNVFIGVGGNSGNEGDKDEAESLVINMQGQKIASKNDLGAYSFRWSPDGSKLALTSDSATTVYDAKLKVIANLPDGNVLGLNWLNNTTITYGLGNNLFSYNISNGDSIQLATNTSGRGITGTSASQDGSQIYVQTEAPGSAGNSYDYTVMRANLSKSVPEYLIELGAFLPLNLNQCSVT